MARILPEPADGNLSRRVFLARTGATAAGLALGRRALAQTTEGGVSVTGAASPDLEPLDRLMASFLRDNRVPGAALAVTRRGKLVYARGFGSADIEGGEAVQPGALFRIASVSKPITSVAILRLVERGLLGLEDKVTDHLRLTPLSAPGVAPDPRWEQITVRQCLQHTGGWDRDASYDPIGRPWDIARALGIQPPVTPADIIRYMMGQPLDFEPGQRYAYSNLGYLVLGRIIAAVTGKQYEAYVRDEVLRPLGLKGPRLGRALLEDRAKGEVRYYDVGKRMGPALYPPRLGQQVPIQYGAENLEAFEAHGGWVASAVDLVKFAAAFDEPANCPILGAREIGQMWARPDGAAGQEAGGTPKAAFYGCGWSVRPVGADGRANTWHTGLIAGTEALLVRRWDGLNWAVLFNTASNPAGESLAGLIDARVHEAVDGVTRWPVADQFDSFLE